MKAHVKAERTLRPDLILYRASCDCGWRSPIASDTGLYEGRVREAFEHHKTHAEEACPPSPSKPSRRPCPCCRQN
jgi:hypothetical protein